MALFQLKQAWVKRAVSVAKQCAERVAAGIQHPQKEQSYQRALAVELAIQGYLTSLEHPAPVVYKASNGCATVLGHERIDVLATHGKLQWSFIIEVKRGGNANMKAAKEQAIRYCRNLTVAGYPEMIAGIVVVFTDRAPRIELAWTFA
jgi:hypothetical protein